MKKRRKTRQWMISLTAVTAVSFMMAPNSLTAFAFEAETVAPTDAFTDSDGMGNLDATAMTNSDMNSDTNAAIDSADFETLNTLPEVWTETYTYLADTGETHAPVGTVEKEGVRYEPSDVQYQITPLTQSLSQESAELWAYAAYEPAQELEENGVHYALTELSTQEWTKDSRFQTVTQYHTYLEGQEIPESLDIEAQDEVTGETITGTIWRSDLWPDGAAWQEGGLEQWAEYSWNGDSWTIEIAGETYYAGEDSPWFEGCEAKLLQYVSLDPNFYQITSVEWNGEAWEDEDGNWKRSVHLTGNRMVPRYQAVFSGDLAEADLPMVRYIAHYTSDPQGYLITAVVTYKKTAQIPASPASDNASNSSDSFDSESNLDLEVVKEQVSNWQMEWNQTLEAAKMWGILLAALAAVGVGLQTAVIFALAHQK